MSNPVERVDITTGDPAEHLARGLKSIRDGYVIVVPLEHGYVYACDAFSHFAVRAMHVLRGDALGVVSQVIISTAKTAQGLSRSMRDDVQKITDAFWPGLLSVNVKPQNGLPTLLDVERFENPGVDVIFDGGHLPAGPRSTVINVSDDGMELIREGAISRESLRKVSPDNFA